MEYGSSVEDIAMKNEKEHVPPQWVLKLLHSFCPPELLMEIEGDLIERFNLHCKKFGSGKAKQKFFWSVIRFFRPGILLRNKLTMSLNPFYMLSNYLKIALRVMFRSKVFSGINVAGLTLGITGAMFLFLWINQEMSFDQFHADKDQLYIGWNRATTNGEISCWNTTPRVLAPTLEKEYSAVMNAVSYGKWESSHLFKKGDTKIMKTSGAFTDPAFLSILSYPLLKGDHRHALENPNSLVLTESFAKQLFGDEEAFGETISIAQDGYTFDFTVTGILKDLPSNTNFDFEYLISFKFLESLGEKDTFWGNNSVTTLVKLQPGTDLSSFNDQIKNIEKKHYVDGQHVEIFLYPLTKMRLYSKFENGVPAGGRIDVMRMLGILGICLVAIACINFTNLSTARGQRRSREVAVRKVTGAGRSALIAQFWFESILTSFIAGVIALILCYLMLPAFSTLVQKNIQVDFTDKTLWAWFLTLIVGVGLLAGSYPAFYLSSFLPVRILKGIGGKLTGNHYLRSTLVVFQFGFAVTMIVAAIVVSKQIRFVQTRDAGYSRDNLLYIPLTGDLKKNFHAFKNDIVQQGLAVSVTRTSAPLTEQWSGTLDMKWDGKDPQLKVNIERIFVDDNIHTTAGLMILQGRDFDLEQFPSDSTSAIVNETALKLMGLENPIGEIVTDDDREYRIIGVVKDFVFTSPLVKIDPIILFGGKESWGYGIAYLKLTEGVTFRKHSQNYRSSRKNILPNIHSNISLQILNTSASLTI